MKYNSESMRDGSLVCLGLLHFAFIGCTQPVNPPGVYAKPTVDADSSTGGAEGGSGNSSGSGNSGGPGSNNNGNNNGNGANTGGTGGNSSGGNSTAPGLQSGILGTWGLCRVAASSVGNAKLLSEREDYVFVAGGTLQVLNTRFEKASCAAGSEFDQEIQNLSYVQGANNGSNTFDLDLQFRSLAEAPATARAATEMNRIRYYAFAQWVTAVPIDVTLRAETANQAPKFTAGLNIYSVVRLNANSISLGVGTSESGNAYDGSTTAKRFRSLGAEQFAKL